VADISQSLGELVHIRRMDKPEALLLSPEQSFFLRENLKMRLLDARLALLQRDGTTFSADINAAQDYVQRYFDSVPRPRASGWPPCRSSRPPRCPSPCPTSTPA
jgi:uroporphyrin-3 C-methyltransferase